MKIIYMLMMMLFLLSCHDRGKIEKKLVISNKMEELILNKSELNLFCYFKAECSFCYGNIMNISKEFPETPLICITKHTDTVLINHYMNQIKFQGTLIIDSLSSFYKSNEEILKNNKLLLVSYENKVIDSTEFELDRVAKKRFKVNIKKHFNKK